MKYKKSIRTNVLILLIAILSLNVFPGCASGPDQSASSGNIIRFTIKIADSGEIDTQANGYYAILLNSLSEPIEVTNYETFTDFIRYDGINFRWFHRQGNVPSPGYTWVDGGNVNTAASISDNGKSIVLRFDLSNSADLFNVYIQSNRFTAHIITTDKNNSLLGRAIDTLGQGPSIDGNSLYTVSFDKTTGIISPLPPGYPTDALEDYAPKSDLQSFPYCDYDIENFSIELE